MYAIGGSADPTINSQGNRYLAPQNAFAKEVIKLHSWSTELMFMCENDCFPFIWNLTSAKNIMMLTGDKES